MASAIVINLKGIPLATTFTLLLKQLGLEYHLQKDGILFITSTESEDSPADPEKLILDNLSALRAEVKALREEVRLLHGRGVATAQNDVETVSDRMVGHRMIAEFTFGMFGRSPDHVASFVTGSTRSR